MSLTLMVRVSGFIFLFVFFTSASLTQKIKCASIKDNIVKKRAPLHLSLEQANEHQRRHGFAPLIKEKKVQQKKLRVASAPEMNQTEREFAALLNARWLEGKIKGWIFQGIRLAWGDGMIYKPDFAVLQLNDRITIVEVKGGHIWSRDIVRWKGCRAQWKDFFDFEIWQKEGGRWTQIA